MPKRAIMAVSLGRRSPLFILRSTTHSLIASATRTGRERRFCRWAPPGRRSEAPNKVGSVIFGSAKSLLRGFPPQSGHARPNLQRQRAPAQGRPRHEQRRTSANFAWDGTGASPAPPSERDLRGRGPMVRPAVCFLPGADAKSLARALQEPLPGFKWDFRTRPFGHASARGVRSPGWSGCVSCSLPSRVRPALSKNCTAAASVSIRRV